jgi:hypothetical protein
MSCQRHNAVPTGRPTQSRRWLLPWCVLGCIVVGFSRGTADAMTGEAKQAKCPQPCLATPSDAALSYYRAAGHHDLRTMRRSIAPGQRKILASNENPDVSNLKRIGRVTIDDVSDDIPLSEISSDIYDPHFDRWVEVSASYDVKWRRVITSGNGRHIAFLIMGRNAETKNWQFFTSGSGP